jgi:hypothetical protein
MVRRSPVTPQPDMIFSPVVCHDCRSVICCAHIMLQYVHVTFMCSISTTLLYLSLCLCSLTHAFISTALPLYCRSHRR